jgi:uncharacterized protein YjbJ (UPF0337 family)
VQPRATPRLDRIRLTRIDPSTPDGGTIVGTDDKLENMKDEKVGEAKETLGKATDDEDMEAEGQVDQTKANLKQAGEKVKDAFK